MTAPESSDLETGRARCADFAARWRGFAARWTRAGDGDPARARTLVREALRDGLPEAKPGAGRQLDDGALQRCAVAVLLESGDFDEEGYAEAHRRSLRKVDPVVHFCTEGWRDLLAPSLGFDLWWYWTAYLDPTREQVNPLLHYLLVGRHQGLLPVPPPPPVHKPTRFAPGTTPRRVCLFAAYDRDGLVDEYVVDYLRELARFCDVYYLADGVLEPGELAKLEGIVRGAWSIPHAAYDFGSYSMLARDLVGWDVIAAYDELVLANDSCFLLRPLDETFATMDARACDWWGLQATSMEFNEDDLDDDEAVMRLDDAKRRLVGPRRWTDVDYLHLSSYLLVFRAPVIADRGFRYRLDTVCGQRAKGLVVHKYEVGISRYLMDAGFEFDTWVESLYPFHPLYSGRFFGLVEAGFPLVKRNFLAENPRFVPDFARWPQWLTAAAPEAPMPVMLRNIERVSPPGRNAAEAEVTIDELTGKAVRPLPPLQGYGFRWMDESEPKFNHWWAFPVSIETHALDPNARAVFEAVKDDPSIRKVVLTRSRRFELDGENLVVVPLASREGQHQLSRCREILVDQPPRQALGLPMTRSLHQFVHLGSGLPTSRTGLAALSAGSAAYLDLATDYRRLQVMVAASQADALAKAAGSPLKLRQLWVTGLPRHDFVTRPYDDLPADLREAEAELRRRLGSRRLLVLWPRPGGTFAAFTPEQLGWLRAWCVRYDAVLGVREAVVDRSDSHSHAMQDFPMLGVARRRIRYPSVVLRVADAVLTDDADDAVDFLITGRALLHFQPTRAADEVPPPFYPPAVFLPGPSFSTFEELTAVLETVFDEPSADQRQAYGSARALAFAHTDDRSGWRLVERIRRQYVDA